MNPKISIIIPCFNVEKYLSMCLDSILNQDYSDYEIIVIDDGSPDQVARVIETYQKKDDRIHGIFQENQGVACTRNRGLKESKGDYIFFVDPDDTIEPNTLSKLMKKVEEENADIVVFHMNRIKQNKKVFLPCYDESISDLYKRYITSNPSDCNKLLKRDLYEELHLNFLENAIYEDLATMPLLMIQAQKICFIDEAFYNYFDRTDSIMRPTVYHTKIEDIFKVMDRLRQTFLQYDLYSKYHLEIEYLYIEHFLRAASLRFLEYPKTEKQLTRIVKEMKTFFPNWMKNPYYQKLSWKKRIMCKLIYYRRYKVIRYLRKRG